MSKNRSTQQIYNSRYGEGAAILDSLRSNVVKHSEVLSAPYRQGIVDAQDDDYNEFGVVHPEWTSPELDTDFNIVQTGSDESWLGEGLSSVGHFLFGDYDNFGNRWKEASVADAWRLFQEKRLQAELGNKQTQLADVEQSIADLDEAERYASLLDSLSSLKKQLDEASASGDPKTIQETFAAYQDTANELASLQEKIKTEGKSRDVFVNLFYDPNKAGIKENIAALGANTARKDVMDSEWYDALNPLKYVDIAANTVTGLVRGAADVLDNVGYTIKNAFQTGDFTKPNLDTTGNFTRRGIKNSMSYDRWTDALFEDYNGKQQTLRDKIQQARGYYDRLLAEKSQAVQEVADKYKNGAWYFDPQKINPKFRELSEHNDSGLLGGILDPTQWAYDFSEMGSSYSDFINMGGMMALDAALNFGMKGVGKLAMKTTPWTNAAATIAEYTKLVQAGETVAAGRMANKVKEAAATIQKIRNNVNLANTAVGAANVGTDLYFTNRMREHETNAELMDAWTSRVLQNSMDRNADMQKVIDTTDNYLRSIGVDTSNFDEQDFVQFALAYNVPTGDQVFEEEKKAGRAGLNKVYNDNMALAAKDYIEMLPFMNYTRSFFRSFGRKGSQLIPEGLATEAEVRAARSIFDNAIDKSANKVSKSIVGALQAKHSMDYIKRLAKARALIGGLEGIEEGQQSLLQTRYQRGEYDTYDQNRSLFPIEGIWNDTRLAWDAALSYFGLNFGDPDNGSQELRRAMQIGATTGVLMGSMGAVSNLLPSSGQDNIRNLVGQLKTDRIVNSIVGETYGKAEDDAHIGMFFDAFSRRGVTVDRLRTSLQDLKQFKGQNTTNEYVDKDIQLLDEAWRQYTNPQLNKYIEDEGVVKGSEKHKDLVKLAVRYNTDKDEAYKMLRNIADEVERKKTETLFAIMNRRDELNSSDFAIYEQLVKDYGQFTKKHHQDRKDLKAKLEQRNPEDFKTDEGYMNPAQINQEIDKRISEFDKGYMDFHDFAEKQIDQLYTYRILTNVDDLIDQYSSQEDLLKLLKKELGIDPNIGKVKSIIGALKNIREAQYKLLDNQNYTLNELIKTYNATLKGKDKKYRQNLRKTFNKQLEEKYGLFSDQADIDNLQKILLLNRAVYDVSAQLANAFNTGKANPIGLIDILGTQSWKSLSKEEQDLFLEQENDKRKEKGWKPLTQKTAPMYYAQAQKQKLSKLKKDEENYKNHLKAYTVDEDSLEGDIDGEVIMRDAFRHLLEHELEQKQERRQIAHREYLRDSVSPEEIVEQAEEGNPEAQTVAGVSNAEKPIDTKEQTKEEKPTTVSDEAAEKPGTASVEEPIGGNENASEESSETDGNLSLEGEEDFEDTNNNNLSVEFPTKSEAQLALEEQLGYEPSPSRRNKSMEKAQDKEENESVEEAEEPSTAQDEEEERQDAAISDETAEDIDANKDLDQIDHTGVSDYDDKIEGSDENTVQNTRQVKLNWLGFNFAYQPEATDTMELKVGDKDVVFRNNGVLRPNGELGQKLLQKGWFEKTDKYFIVCQKNVDQIDLKNPDNFVVGLAIQDGKDVYVVTMKDLSRKVSYTGGALTTGDTGVYKELDTLYDLPEYKTKEAYKSSIEYGIVSEYVDSNTNVDPLNVSKEDAYNWFNHTATQDQKNRALWKARKRRAGGKDTVPTDEQINTQIAQLRATRNQIINTCCERDSEGNYILLADGYKIVRPNNPRISRGKFNNVRENGIPVYQGMLEAPFGLSTDVEQLTKDIRSEKVKIGVGKGKYSYDGEGAIAKLDPNEIGDYSGTGYGRAGKLYLIVEDLHGKEAALMLREQHFEYDNDGNRIGQDEEGNINVDNVREAFDASGNIKPGTVPSLAEIVMRTVTGRISDRTFKEMGVQGYEFIEALSHMLVNHGESTFVKNEQESEFYTKKQLWVKDGFLYIALPNVKGTYWRNKIDIDRLYSDEKLRKKVILAISQNFHWNTSRDAMVEGLDEGILGPLRQFFDTNKKIDSISLFGNKDLTFKRDELFDQNMEDKDVSHVAWMIMNNKIITDIGDTVFYAPFVYADGALAPSDADNKVSKAKAASEKRTAKAGAGNVKPSKQQERISETEREERYKSWYKNTVGSKSEPVAKQAVSESTRFADDISAEDQLVYIDVYTGDLEDNFIDDDEIKKNISVGVDRFLSEYNKEHGTKYTHKDLSNKITEDDYEILREGRKAVTVRLNDKQKAIFASPLTPDFVQQATVTGVYCSDKTSGELSKDDVKNWIKQTLGLEDSQILITNAVLRGVSGKEVFGVTTLAVNRINGNLRGMFMLRKDAGQGIHFHEAFHYVNLLLHSPKQRRQIYEAYAKQHKELAGAKFKDIEEAIAEEFRVYCEEREYNRDGFVGWLRRMFDTIIDFVKVWIRKDQVRKLFNDIREGQFKNASLDQESVSEFLNKYDGYVFQSEGSIPVEGTFNAIDSYKTFYDVAESIANNFIYSAGLNRVSRITNLSPSKFKEFFDSLSLMGLDSNPFIKDVIDNQAAFQDVMIAILKQYGISARTKDKFIQDTDAAQISDNNRTDDEPSGERELFTWDKYQFEISAKDNVAFRAKLFLTQVKDKRFVYDPETGVRSLVDVQHPLTGLNGFVSFDDAWIKILNNLHDVDGYQEFLKETERLAKTDAFFASLLENLYRISGDVELENQIFNTVSKHNPQVAQTHIADKVQYAVESNDDSSNMDVGEDQPRASFGVKKQNDQFREIEIHNDNTLKAVRMLPRDWSKAFFASPMVKFNGSQNVINGEYAKQQLARYKTLVSKLEAGKKQDANKKQELYDIAKDEFLSIINNLSIPFDDSSLDVYIDMHIQSGVDRDDIEAKYNVLSDIVADKKSGSIGYFITEIFGKPINHNKPTIKIRTKQGSKDKQLDRIYEGYGKEMSKLAAAYNSVHPSSRELSVTAPNGSTIYPISENNYISDVIRWLNKDKSGIIETFKDSPYSEHSQLIRAAEFVNKSKNKNDLMLKLNVVVGMKDVNENKGVDYFGVNTLEDTINKMMFIDNNMLVLPTMADKKTFYTIELISRQGNKTESYLHTPHDILTTTYENDQIKANRFSDDTLSIFEGYFRDELRSLMQYYDKENIKQLVEHPERLKANFHGKVKNGRMDFSGNGGKFRYFYGLLDDYGLNLNEALEAAWKKQQFMENPEYGTGVYQIRKDDQELDGFELVREKLDEIQKYFEDKELLYACINDLLLERVDESIRNYSKPNTDNQLLKTLQTFETFKDAEGNSFQHPMYYTIARAIPSQLLYKYQDIFKKKGYKVSAKGAYRVSKNPEYNHGVEDLARSVIGNYVVGQMMSIIEVEKIITGDPAFYKWKTGKAKDVEVDGIQMSLSQISEKDTDKIKRLGAVLSPGSELRQDYTEEEFAKYPWLRGTKYTNVHISDVSAKSIYLDQISNLFEKQAVADKFRYEEKYRDSGITADDIFANDEKFNEAKKLLSKEDIDDVTKQVDASTSPYGANKSITVADAQVLIRPEAYRKIRAQLGQWSFKKTKFRYKGRDGKFHTTYYSDEDAYNIIQTNPNWIGDDELYAKVMKLQLFPLKMTYFENSNVQLSDKNNVIMPMYNKMAIFPAFKYLFTSKTGKQVYDRMNKAGEEIDMFTFESAVKVGLNAKRYAPYKDYTETLSEFEDGLNKSSKELGVVEQDFAGIRMQLNTEAHTDAERSIGTQMFKILFSNIIDTEEYSGRSGKDIRNEIMSCINALTAKGVHTIKKKFFDSTMSVVDKNKMSKWLQHVAENNGVSSSVIDAIKNYGIVSNLMISSLFQSSINSIVNDKVININTKGGSAVQQSVFGFASYGANSVLSEESLDLYPVMNNGRELKWIVDEPQAKNSMEVILSMNFFKAVVPKDKQNNYMQARQWLIDNDIIKGFKTDGTESMPKPFGVGYRIPTQGMSSTFAFTVADVLPEQSGDLIIVPREFTAQTGSDFDVDKLYLATLSYKNGELESAEGDDLVNMTEGQIGNKLISNYINILTDDKNFSNARGSIDVVTDKIQNEVLSIIKATGKGYAPSMYELTPDFQSRRKSEFSTGKNGIGPFALNITNLALTQFSHLSMDFQENEFGFKDLDSIVGDDGYRISDWLSAMVNAHVDVAKDPYVFDLNVNQATYKFVNFLLRTGKGKATFLFLAQPALKEWASEFNNSGGIYGDNLYMEKEKVAKYKILDDVIDRYKKKIKEKIDKLEDDKNKIIWNKKVAKISSSKLTKKEWATVFGTYEKETPNGTITRYYAEDALQNPESLRGLQYQLMALKALKRIEPYAQELSDLVKVSRIDTKRFGNVVSLHRNFINTYNVFKYKQREVDWKCTDGYTGDPLTRYFESTFLETKLFSATNMSRELLKRVDISATDMFGDLMNTLLGRIYGFEDPIVDKDGKTHILYKPVSNDDKIKAMYSAAESVVKNKMLMFYGQDVYRQIATNPVETYTDYYNYRKVESDNGFSGPIDFTFGGNTDIMHAELYRIMFGDPYASTPYYRNSIFTNIAKIIGDIQLSTPDEINKDYTGLADPATGRIVNELLNYLRPQPAGPNNKIPHMLLAKTNRNTIISEKERLTSSFDFMLRHNNPLIRKLARDIAVYSYYSTYNTNNVNTFFDLVPPYFRQQYDLSIKAGLDMQNASGQVAAVEDSNGVFSPSANINSLLDLICRNYYNDNEVVPIYQIQYANSYADKDFGEYHVTIRDTKTKPVSVIPSFVATTLANVPYFKMVVNNNIYLYKLRGVITKENAKGEVEEGIWNVYTLTQKLGLHDGSTHQYELSASAQSNSIYEQNVLPASFSEDLVASQVQKFIQKSQNAYKDGKIVYTSLEKSLTIIKEERNDKYDDIDSGIVSDENILISERPIDQIGDLHINLDEFSADDVVAEYAPYEKDGVSISIDQTKDIKISKKELDSFVKEQGALWRSRNPQLGEDAYNDFIEQSKDAANNILIQQKRVRMLADAMTELSERGIHINSIFTNNEFMYKHLADSQYEFIDNVVFVKNEDSQSVDTNPSSVILSQEESAALEQASQETAKQINTVEDIANEASQNNTVSDTTNESDNASDEEASDIPDDILKMLNDNSEGC